MIMQAALAGNPIMPVHDGHNEATDHAAIDAALADLDARKTAWTELSAAARADLLDQIIVDTAAVADEWNEAGIVARKLIRGRPQQGEDYIAGPWPTIRAARLYGVTLRAVAANGSAEPGRLSTSVSGQVVARAFPQNMFDRLLYDRVTVDVWMEPGVSEFDVRATMASTYCGEAPSAGVSLVLGAGNVSAISSTDVLHKLLVDNKVVMLKMNPVNDYAGPFIEKAFKCLIDAGFMRVVYGGVEVGAYLTQHELIADIHMTGSDKTHDAIVFGVGEEGARRKASCEPSNLRPVSAELGNVTPIIVVPGPWKPGQVRAQAEAIASQITVNVGFNCVTGRVVLTHASWDQRPALLDGMREVLRAADDRHAYYPGAAERVARFVDAHPEAESFGGHAEGSVPYTLIAGVDTANTDDICFRTEAFAPLMCEAPLEADGVVAFIQRAVAFSNETCWGSLAAHILVHPASMRDPAIEAAVEAAIADLRYGTIAVNTWAGLGFLLMNGHWGAFPGHEISDIQSGTGWVHNTSMYARPQKSVIKAPFSGLTKPLWFPSHTTADRLGAAITRFEAQPRWRSLPRLTMLAMRG
jgi:acyl-CoA reductase-like NAD-dependent aldehyde dehydrogenase